MIILYLIFPKKNNHMESEKKMFLLDAYALIFRSYYAFIRNPRFTSTGLNTSAIFGFTNTLLEILQKEQPSHLGVVFDPPGPTFRNEMYAEYKANREETPEDIKRSVPYIKQIINAFNIKQVEVNGYEADDVIGTLAHRAVNEGFKVYMMTPDKDYCQLVKENIFVYKPKKGGNESEIMGVKEVNDRYSIRNPLEVIDVLALMGDSSDNVPGAPGIGEKTAIKLISQFETVEKLIENVEQLKGKQKDNIRDNIDLIKLSKKLVTIDVNVPVEGNFNEYVVGGKDENEVVKIFNELEFKTLMQRVVAQRNNEPLTTSQPTLFDNDVEYTEIPGKKFKNIENTPHNYRLVDSIEKINELVKLLENQHEFCFDTETTGLEWHKADLVGMAFSIAPSEAYYVPVNSDKNEAQSVVNCFKHVFENDQISKIGQNIKYDILILMNYNVFVKGKIFDTLIAHYLLQPELKHGLDYLANIYLDYQMVSIESLIGAKGKNQLSMRSVPVEKVKEYAGEDADITYKLKDILLKQLKKENLLPLATEIEMPLTLVLADIEKAGFTLDVNSLNEYAKILQEEAIITEQKIYQHAGYEFNIASPKQLGEVLFDRMKIDENAKRTKTKQYSTSEETLIKLKDKHPIISLILDFRSLKKLLSTYIEALPGLINNKTGKIHTSFNQAVAATGRLSSNKPNLQNIPIREERGKEIRKSFIPSDNNHILVAADYSQIELRLMAHMSGDRDMIEAFERGEDIHTATAAKIYNTPLDKVTGDMRRNAKTANFGIIYGISAFGLSQRLNIPRSEAKELIDGYFENFSRVKMYMDECIKKARETGYVETMMGRRRYLKDINSRNGVVRGVAERNAINAPIQGSAADIIKLAMVKISEMFHVKQINSKMILQVHDELIFDVQHDELEDVKKIVKQEMENAVQLKVPLIVEMGSGNNWLEAH